MRVVQPWDSIPERLWSLHPWDFEKPGLDLKLALLGVGGWMNDLQRSLSTQVSQWSHACRAGVNLGCGAPLTAPTLQGCSKSAQEPPGLPGGVSALGRVWNKRDGKKGNCCKTLGGVWRREKPQESEFLL